MKIGVFSVLFQNLPLEAALDKIAALGIGMVEIGSGGYPGSHHCPVEELLSSESRRHMYQNAFHSRSLEISALSCHSEPLSPDPKLAREADRIFKDTVRLARKLKVPVVNVLSGLPAGCPGDKSPNWITCPWPPHFLKMREYQWNKVAIPYWKKATRFASDHGIRVACEMHPGMLVYNVETLLRLREAAGPNFGCNLDLSHLFWNGVNPVAAIRTLGNAIFHMHGKDCAVDALNVAVNGCNDPKPYGEVPARSWTFRTMGYGHDEKVWKDILSGLRSVGYDYVISVEHEDPLLSIEEGLSKGVEMLKRILLREQPGTLFWA